MVQHLVLLHRLLLRVQVKPQITLLSLEGIQGRTKNVVVESVLLGLVPQVMGLLGRHGSLDARLHKGGSISIIGDA
jgi:hypothetical protein